MDGYSQMPKEERLKILQSIMPESFGEGKIDWGKLRATLGEDVNFADERYRLLRLCRAARNRWISITRKTSLSR